MYQVVDVGGVTTLKWALLALFVLNFSWIALSFASAVVGFVALLSQRRPPACRRDAARDAPPSSCRSTTRRRAASSRALQTIYEDVQATGLGAHFDWFFLSDTTNPDIWIAEERAFIGIRRRLGPQARIYYRRREKNIGRKAGNIEDFVTRWGGAYDAYGRARRRQPDDRRRPSCGSPPRWRRTPTPASSRRCR